MENQVDDQSLSPAMSGECLDTIKRLAHDHFIQLEIGTTAEFEKLWREAFSVERADDGISA
jgi:hypothetical protein